MMEGRIPETLYPRATSGGFWCDIGQRVGRKHDGSEDNCRGHTDGSTIARIGTYQSINLDFWRLVYDQPPKLTSYINNCKTPQKSTLKHAGVAKSPNHKPIFQAFRAEANDCSKSWMISSICSVPTDTRIKSYCGQPRKLPDGVVSPR
jgi:hypothetical protein